MAFRVRNPGEKDEYVEVGASIFVKVNHNLFDATEDFALKTKPLDDEKLAIWDGHQFVFEESQWKFWNIWQGLRRWGLAPLKVTRDLLFLFLCLPFLPCLVAFLFSSSRERSLTLFVLSFFVDSSKDC